MQALKSKLRSLRGHAQSADQILVQRLERRQSLIRKGLQVMPYLRALLLVIGLGALLVLPSDALNRRVYISENAIQPAQVNTYWGWADVHKADRFASDVDTWRHMNSTNRADAILSAFRRLGLPAATQRYTFRHSATPTSSIHAEGTNVYSILQAPRADGAEALVLAASWRTRAQGRDVRGGSVNVRGVASVLALAEYLQRMNLWSKDIIFLISDGYLDGTEAWLQAYHETSHRNAQIEPLVLRTGSIWAALSLDFPYHSFDHLGIFYEGANGQLPNLDLINSAVHIARYAGGVPIRLHDNNPDLRADYFPLTSPLHSVVDHVKIKEYVSHAATMLQQASYAAVGSPSGPEGAFGRFKIDSICFYASPAEGTHGFYAMGRTVESMLRSLNNILERLHQSFFLYLMQGTESFVSVGNYLMGPVIVSVAVTLTGLEAWEETFKKGVAAYASGDKSKAPRDVYRTLVRGPAVVAALKLMLATHIFGIMTTSLLASFPHTTALGLVAILNLVLPIYLALSTVVQPCAGAQPLSAALRPFLLLFSGCLMAVASTLNFPLGVCVAVLYGPGLCYLRPSGSSTIRRSVGFVAASLVNPLVFGALASFFGNQTVARLGAKVYEDWVVLGTWFLPFMGGIVSPLAMQAASLSLLD